MNVHTLKIIPQKSICSFCADCIDINRSNVFKHTFAVLNGVNRICYYISNTTGGAGSAYPSGAHEITPSFLWGSCCLFFSFLCCVMCAVVCLYVFFIFGHGGVSKKKFRFMSLIVPLVSFVPLLVSIGIPIT